MKKVLVGCLIVLVVAAVLAAVGGYYFIYRPARSYIASFQQIGDIPEIEAGITNKQPFTEPNGGLLSEGQVARYLRAAGRINDRLGARAGELKARYDRMQLGREGRSDAALSQVLGAFRDLVEFFVEGKRAQVDALNEAGFSLDEYNWVKEHVYAAAGVALSQIDVTELSRAASGETPDLEPRLTGTGEEVPQQNRSLVAPHVEKLREFLAFGFFGL
ncbi:MAG: hypothetical protein ACE148_00500 [Vicinamibacterales bacterium]